MRVHLKFDPLTLRSIPTGEVSDSGKSALFIDMLLHGLGSANRNACAVPDHVVFERHVGGRAAWPCGPQHLQSWEAGMGLNHVSILVHDLPATLGLFRDQLGFNANSWGRFAEGPENGLENGGIEFSNHTYLEFLAVYDPQKAASSDEVGIP